MKVVGFNGSPRKEGNTSILIKTVFKELEQEGIETDLVQLRGKKLAGCIACFKCFSNALIRSGCAEKRIVNSIALSVQTKKKGGVNLNHDGKLQLLF